MIPGMNIKVLLAAAMNLLLITTAHAAEIETLFMPGELIADVMPASRRKLRTGCAVIVMKTSITISRRVPACTAAPPH